MIKCGSGCIGFGRIKLIVVKGLYGNLNFLVIFEVFFLVGFFLIYFEEVFFDVLG